MDYKQLFPENFDPVTLPNGERVYASCGDHFVWWMPEEFYGVPDDSLTEEEKHDWYERRAAYRYSSNGSLTDGKIQKLCPQCAGRIIYAEKTRMGKYRNAPHPDSALSFGPPLAAGYCCRGSVTLGGDELGHWQPIPWRTRAQSKLYRWGPQPDREHQRTRQRGRRYQQESLPSAWDRTPQHGVLGYGGRQQRPVCRGRSRRRSPARRHAQSGTVAVLYPARVRQRHRRHRSRRPRGGLGGLSRVTSASLIAV